MGRKEQTAMIDVPDWRLDPPESNPPICPICGAETDTFYVDKDGEIFGCGECVKAKDAWDWGADNV